MEYISEEKSLLKSVIDDLKADKRSILEEKNGQIEKLKENQEKLNVSNANIVNENKKFSERINDIEGLNVKLKKDLDEKNIKYNELKYFFLLIVFNVLGKKMMLRLIV